MLTGAGLCTVVATQSGDEDWAPVEARRGILVARASQRVDFADPGAVRLGDPPRELVAAATSGLPVSIEAAGTCEVVQGGLRATGAGTCTLTATQDGNDDWAPATPVSRELGIERAIQRIAFAPLDETTFGAEPIALAARATSGLPVTIGVDGPCLIMDGRLRATGAGTCTLTATQPGDDDWAPADPVTRELAIEPADQTITFDPIDDAVYRSGPIEISATASSGLPVSVQAEGPCVVGPTGALVLTSAGTCSVTASQAGDDDWAPAEPVTRELTIERASQRIAFPALEDAVFGVGPIALPATATSGLPVSVEAEGPCLVDPAGDLVLTGAGDCRLTASQDGNDDWAPALPVSGELIIERAEQTIAFEPLDGTVFGAAPARARRHGHLQVARDLHDHGTLCHR